MNWYSSNLVKALLAAVVVIVIFNVAGTPESSEKIYDYFNPKPVVTEPVQPDPDAVEADLRSKHMRLAASAPPADKPRLDLFVDLVTQCIGHMQGRQFDLSRALAQPFGYDAADTAKSLSISADFPENIRIYFSQTQETDRVRPEYCFVAINAELTDSQIETLHAAAVPTLDGLLARGWNSSASIARIGETSVTTAFIQYKDPFCTRSAAFSYRLAKGDVAGQIGFTALENGNGCKFLAALGSE